MRLFLVPIFAATALIAACGNVYDKPIPDIQDEAAINEVISSVDGPDKTLLRGYFFRKNNVRLGYIEAGPKELNSAKSVREAIAEQKLVLKRLAEEERKTEEASRQADEAANEALADIDRQMAELAK